MDIDKGASRRRSVMEPADADVKNTLLAFVQHCRSVKRKYISPFVAFFIVLSFRIVLNCSSSLRKLNNLNVIISLLMVNF